MSTFDTDGILAGIDGFFEGLPAKRRGRRTRAEIDAPIDDAAEVENYGKLCLWDALTGTAGRGAADDPAQALVLAWGIKGRIALLCRSSHRMREDKALHGALTQLVTMVGGNESEELTNRAVAICHGLEWSRKQAALFGPTGLLFKSEADWQQYRDVQGGAE